MDTLPPDDPLTVARTLDFSQENLVPAKENEIQSSQNSDGCSEVLTRDDGFNNELRDDDSHNDAEIKEVDCLSVKESSKKETDADGLLLVIPQEFESESAMNVGNESSQLFEEPPNGKLSEDHGAPRTEETNGSDVEVKQGQNLDTKAPNSESGTSKKTTSQASKMCLSSSTVSKYAPKTMSRPQADGPSRKKKNPVEDEGADRALPASNNAFRRSLSIGVSRSNFTVPQPFALATDKRASIGGRPVVGEAPMLSPQPRRLTGTPGNPSLKDFQVSKKIGSKFVAVKSLHSENTKPVEESLVKSNVSVELKADDDDVQSISSVGSKAPRAKLTSGMSAIGFSFKCDERAEKRKQFYTKLEEMHVAKEEEKNQIQAKTKEEMEAEIKQLRKSLTFKATPMPTFYREGAPPKVELKKIPTTRAKSPKLGRRNSSIGVDSEGSNGRSGRSNGSELEPENTSSDSLQRATEENADKGPCKSNMENLKKPVRRTLSRLTSDKSMKAKVLESIEVPNHDATCLDSSSVTTIVNGSNESTQLREGSEVEKAASVHPNDDEVIAEQVHENVNDLEESIACTDKVSEEDVSSVRIATAPEPDFVAASVPADVSAKDDNLTSSKGVQKRDCSRSKSISADITNGTKAKTGRSLQQVAKEENHDAKATKTIKKERLKASTPLFRLRHENVGNESFKRAIKSDHDMSPVVSDVAVHS